MPSGFLRVTFPMQRQVYVRGSPNGFTNIANQADAGNAVPVTLEGNDYEPAVQYVDIYPNQTAATSFTLKPKPPSVNSSGT